jgi:hypothetical protein
MAGEKTRKKWRERWDRREKMGQRKFPSEIHAVPFVFRYFGTTTGQL